ncbi:MAG: Ran GTPase activating protein [Amphiamblys sp. WSBS2006]|nr:MAG: Ran GTPase activating protein [Amphiamblys sp. WSBS2006]
MENEDVERREEKGEEIKEARAGEEHREELDSLKELKEELDGENSKKEENPEEEQDLSFTPVVKVEKQETKTLEEDEETLFSIRAKLFRLDDGQWKERGVGEAKFLKHREKGTVRLVMRRDKTHKVCANHTVLPEMALKENTGSDRAWVYKAPLDFTEDKPQSETFAIRFATAEKRAEFREAFEDAKKTNKEIPAK